MKTLIVFDSVFGNTERLAGAVAAAMSAAGQVELVRAGDFGLEKLAGVDFLLVGSPTRAFRPVKPVVDGLKRIPAGALAGIKVAAFDTRMDTAEVKSRLLGFMAGVFGYAAKPIAAALVKKGGRLASAPEGFIVGGSEGPLKDGELDRAAQWARSLAG